MIENAHCESKCTETTDTVPPCKVPNTANIVSDRQIYLSGTLKSPVQLTSNRNI